MLKNYLVTIATSLGLPQNLCHFCNPHMTTSAERLTKIGLVVAEIFGRICWFLLSRPKKVQLLPLQSLGLLDRMSPRLYTDVEKCILFNLLKSELWYCNPFWNGSTTRRLVHEKCRFFDFNWLPWQRPLKNKKEDQIGHIRTNTYHLVQRSRKSVQWILI